MSAYRLRVRTIKGDTMEVAPRRPVERVELTPASTVGERVWERQGEFRSSLLFGLFFAVPALNRCLWWQVLAVKGQIEKEKGHPVRSRAHSF
jgi:hypothetical protein